MLFLKDYKRKKNSLFLSLTVVVSIATISFLQCSKQKGITIETSTTAIDTITINKNYKVYLNRNSKVFYNNTLNSALTLNLTGESYIENTKFNPINIETDFGFIETKNASFNVKSKLDILQVTCYNGSLKIHASNKEIYDLEKGAVFQILGDKITRKKTFDTHPKWILQKTKFTEAPFFEVVDELEKYYNVKVVLRNVDVGMLYTGMVDLNNLEKALETISDSLDLKYRIFDKKVVITQFLK